MLEQKAHEDLRAAKMSHNQLQEEANEEMPAGISGLQAAKDVRVWLAMFVVPLILHCS